MNVSIVDTSQLFGPDLNGSTYSTRIENKHDMQVAYAFLKPISERRSVDGEDGDILSWNPKTETYQRQREWYENGFQVPEDVSLSEDAVGVLSTVRGVTRDSDENPSIELYLPPLDEGSIRHIKQELVTEHGIIATQGGGREPLLVADEDSVTTLQQYEHDW